MTLGPKGLWDTKGPDVRDLHDGLRLKNQTMSVHGFSCGWG